MGCVCSKADINDRHPNIFQVINVNEQGLSISPGKLQVTESELILYQKGKEPTRWPLRSLRKYGFDTEVFSFECGRRCPTGQGIYAFRCRKAEQLFNAVSEHISGSINDEGANNGQLLNSNPNNMEFPIPAVSTGPPVMQRRPPDGYLNPISNNTARHPAIGSHSRPGSITSNGNGPLSPTISPPPLELAMHEHNNNKRSSLGAETQHSYTNSSAIVDNLKQISMCNGNGPMSASYINCELTTSVATPPTNETSHVYMNIDTKDATFTKDNLDLNEVDSTTHCYANIDAKDIESLRGGAASRTEPPTPTSCSNAQDFDPSYPEIQVQNEVNYVELDLVSNNNINSTNVNNNSSSSNAVETSNASNEEAVAANSPEQGKKGYATIDFQKTNALSKSINPPLESVEEGSRKTRHNSTINYNNSLSD